jgi:hypothetical protein
VGLLAVDAADWHSSVFAVVVCGLLAEEAKPVFSPIRLPALQVLLNRLDCLSEHKTHVPPHFPLLLLRTDQSRHFLRVKLGVNCRLELGQVALGHREGPIEPGIAYCLKFPEDVFGESDGCVGRELLEWT